jgi:hypothetical protein
VEVSDLGCATQSKHTTGSSSHIAQAARRRSATAKAAQFAAGSQLRSSLHIKPQQTRAAASDALQCAAPLTIEKIRRAS